MLRRGKVAGYLPVWDRRNSVGFDLAGTPQNLILFLIYTKKALGPISAINDMGLSPIPEPQVSDWRGWSLTLCRLLPISDIRDFYYPCP